MGSRKMQGRTGPKGFKDLRGIQGDKGETGPER